MTTTVQGQKDLLDATEIDLSLGFRGSGISCEGVHVKLALREVWIMVKGFYRSSVKCVRRVGRENLLSVETKAKT